MSLLVWLLKVRPFLLSGGRLHGDAQFLIVAAAGGPLLKRTGEEAGGGTGLVLRGPGGGERKQNVSSCTKESEKKRESGRMAGNTEVNV